MKHAIDGKQLKQFYSDLFSHFSGESVINHDERYAVHRFKNTNGSSKYLVIPFGVTFAN